MVDSEEERDTESSEEESVNEKITRSKKLKKAKPAVKRAKKGDFIFNLINYLWIIALDDTDPFKVGSSKPEYERHVLLGKKYYFSFIFWFLLTNLNLKFL